MTRSVDIGGILILMHCSDITVLPTFPIYACSSLASWKDHAGHAVKDCFGYTSLTKTKKKTINAKRRFCRSNRRATVSIESRSSKSSARSKWRDKPSRPCDIKDVFDVEAINPVRYRFEISGKPVLSDKKAVNRAFTSAGATSPSVQHTSIWLTYLLTPLHPGLRSAISVPLNHYHPLYLSNCLTLHIPI